MGIIADAVQLARMLAPPQALASPLADTSVLAPVLIPTIDDAPASRDQAMTVPALLRARNLICSTVGRMQIIAHKGGVDLPQQPAWISRTDGPLSPFHRALWTADDLLFHGWSLWSVTRDFHGHVLTADRINFADWSFAPDGRVLVLGQSVPANNVVLIPGIHEGILRHGASTIREALAISAGVTRAVETPAAAIELHQTNDRPITLEEIERLKADWVKARKGAGGGVAYTSSAIEVKEHGAPREHLLVEGRNAVAVDIARLAGIPASMIDATLGGTSLSYSNTASRLAELIAFGIAPMMAALTARLGMDDVVPRGVALRIDTTEAVEVLKTFIVPDDGPTPLEHESTP